MEAFMHFSLSRHLTLSAHRAAAAATVAVALGAGLFATQAAPTALTSHLTPQVGGAGYVTGRIQGLAVSGGTIYAGGAAGGVWRSADGGTTWTPISDGSTPLPAQSIGVMKVDKGALWVATGDGTTGSGTYAGNGV